MSTPPGQEPRPAFTPRAGQARPAARAGDSGRADGGSRRDAPGSRRPAPGSSGRGPGGAGGGSRNADREVDDYWRGGKGDAGGTGSRPQPGFSPRRDPGPRDPAPRAPGRPDPGRPDPG